MATDNFKLGGVDADNIMLGSSEVSRIYKGDTLVWDRAPAAEDLTGIIAMFPTSTMPTGWVVCDGLNSTPDLRDRFIVCRGSTYSAGATGGDNTVTLAEGNLASHNHTATSGSGGSHTHTSSATAAAPTHSHTLATDIVAHQHTYDGAGNMGNVANQFANMTGIQSSTAGIATGNATEPAHTAATSNTAGAHSHTVNSSGTHTHTATTNSAGTSGAHENRPPYYALVFAQATATATVADGMIAMTELASAPAGWAICNGTAALPDLRDRFIVGAGSTYAVDATGGSNTVALTTATMPLHTHNLSVTADNVGHAHNTNSTTSTGHSHGANLGTHSAHSHTYSRVNAATITSTQGATNTLIRVPYNAGNTYNPTNTHPHNVSFDTATDTHQHTSSNSTEGAHNHTATGGNSGSGTAHENRPPYRAAHFIRKVTEGFQIPSGVIALCHQDQIPAGWALCDGMSAPDYRDRFAVGAGSTYAVGAVGGFNFVTLSIAEAPLHTHNGTVSNLGAHGHSLSNTATTHTHNASAAHGNHAHSSVNAGTAQSNAVTGTGVSTMVNYSANAVTSNHNHSHGASPVANNTTHAHNLIDPGNHTHTMTMGNVGSGTAHENRPPYYALAFIQKL